MSATEPRLPRFATVCARVLWPRRGDRCTWRAVRTSGMGRVRRNPVRAARTRAPQSATAENPRRAFSALARVGRPEVLRWSASLLREGRFESLRQRPEFARHDFDTSLHELCRRLILEEAHQGPLQSRPVQLRASAVLIVHAVRHGQRVNVLVPLKIGELNTEFGEPPIISVNQALNPIFDRLPHRSSDELTQSIDKERVELLSKAVTVEIDRPRSVCELIHYFVFQIVKPRQLPSLEIANVFALVLFHNSAFFWRVTSPQRLPVPSAVSEAAVPREISVAQER